MAVCVAAAVVPAHANVEALARARQLYNAGDYDAAVTAAQDARRDAETADAAAIVLARAQLERFRLAGDPADLMSARTALRAVDRARLGPRDAMDHAVGLAEALYVDGAYGAAAEMFEPLLRSSAPLEPATRARVVDWWAGALDAEARARPAPERAAYYERIVVRMEAELDREPFAAVASYWLAAAALGAGDPLRAWQAAVAGWIRASFAAEGGGEVRGDLDRLVAESVIPARTRRESSTREDRAAAAAALQAAWEGIKDQWR